MSKAYVCFMEKLGKLVPTYQSIIHIDPKRGISLLILSNYMGQGSALVRALINDATLGFNNRI